MLLDCGDEDCGECALDVKHEARNKNAGSTRTSMMPTCKISGGVFTAGAFDARGLRQRGV